MEKKEIYEVLSRIVNERMEVKAKLNMVSYLLRGKKTVYDDDINYLLDKLAYLDKIEEELREKLKEKE